MENLYLRLAPALVPILEVILIGSAGLLIFWSQSRNPGFSKSSSFRSLKRALNHLARRRALSCFAVGGTVIVVRLALIPVLGVPQPRFHDEFSFLLAADTFAHGRITNPTHPMWKHFESFHIIWQPTYMSMYPPGEGVLLSAGQLLGHPWIFQLIAAGFMVSTICWMLQGWVPPQLALLGAALVALRLAVLSYWVNSYFCGSLIAVAGALVLGALPRIKRHSRLRDSVAMGLGLAILANTRPYEGFVYSLPFAGALLFWVVTQKRHRRSAVVLRIILPLFLILAITGFATCYYFWRVTGNPFVMPYQANRQAYAIAPYFIWQQQRAEFPVYRHPVMEAFYRDSELRDFEAGRSALGFVQRLEFKAKTLWLFYVGPILSIPLLVLPCIFRDRKMRFPLLVTAIVMAGSALEVWTGAHYVAAATGLLFLLLVQCMRHLRLWRREHGCLGEEIVRAVVFLCVAIDVARVCLIASGTAIEPAWPRGNLQRSTILKQLENLSGQQLVVVRYHPDHGIHNEWVYNLADIDNAKVVWARDMGETENRELIGYFKQRRIWLLDADDTPPKLQPYGDAH
jgi:hypothetical protein